MSGAITFVRSQARLVALAVVLAVPMSFATLIEKPARPALGSAVSAVHPLDLASLTLADFGDSN